MPGPLPIVFACSGCSNAGQLANRMALELDRRGHAQMSCLAGVGAGKRHFLKQLHQREVWIIDGCPIECALGIFQQVQQRADAHIRLHTLGVQKNGPPPCDPSFEDLIAASLDQVAHQRLAPQRGDQ